MEVSRAFSHNLATLRRFYLTQWRSVAYYGVIGDYLTTDLKKFDLKMKIGEKSKLM